MKIKDFMEELAYSELSDIPYNMGDGQIKPDAQPKIIIKLNDVLASLHTKYVIRLESAVIDTVIKRLIYEYTNPNSVRIVYVSPIIPDFTDIYDTNDQFAVQGNKLVFLKAPNHDSFSIQYQWKPARLKISPADSRFLEQDFNLNPVFLPLVRTLVASSIFMSLNGELHKKTGVELYNLAQAMIVDLELSGDLITSVGFEHNRFKVNGFV